jgi:hypothetical protein
VRISTLLLLLGLPCLPFMWLLNVVMFYPAYRVGGCSAVVARNVRLSFLGALLWTIAGVSWAVFYRVHAAQMQRWSFGSMWSYMWGQQTRAR